MIRQRQPQDVAVNVCCHPPNRSQTDAVHQHIHDVIQHRVRHAEQPVCQHQTQRQRHFHTDAQVVDERAVNKRQTNDKDLVRHQQHGDQDQQPGATLSGVFGPDDFLNQANKIAQLWLGFTIMSPGPITHGDFRNGGHRSGLLRVMAERVERIPHPAFEGHR